MQALSCSLRQTIKLLHACFVMLALNTALLGCVNGGQPEPKPEAGADQGTSETTDSSWASEPAEATDAGNDGVPPYVPKTGQHGLLVRCGGSPATAENPYRIALGLLRDPESFFDHHITRAQRLHDITGNARVVFHMLNGWDDEGMWHSAAVLDAMPPRRRAAFERAVATLTDAGITVGTYSAAKVPDRIDSVRIDDVGEGEHFDYDNPDHRETMMSIFMPLIELGVTEIWLDNSSPAVAREDWVKMARDLRAHGAYLVMEATPLTRPRPRQLDLETIQHLASVSWNRRIYLHNDLEDDHWLPLPEDTELIAVLSLHQTHDQSVPTGRQERLQYLAEQTAKRLAQGFTVFNMQEAFDEKFFELIEAWTQQQSQSDATIPSE